MYKINIECELINNTFSIVALNKIKKMAYKEVDFNYNMNEVDTIDVSIDKYTETFDIKIYFKDDIENAEIISLEYNEVLVSLF